MADEDVQLEEEYEYEEVYEEVEEEIAVDEDGFADNDGFDDDDGGWGDDDINVEADQQFVIPITKQTSSTLSVDDDEEYELDHHGNIISPRADALKKQKSAAAQQCWTCSNCKSINKLTWTLSKFAMKCCICKQPTYSIQAKIFDSDTWDEPSNDFWECSRCTLHNAIGSNECGACGQANDDALAQANDDDNGSGEFQSVSDSSDDHDDATHAQSQTGMQGMQGMHGMRMGMGMGPMGGGDFFNNLMGSMGGGVRPQRRAPKPPPDTRPFSKRKEERLRNLLIVGFMRSCDAIHLPAKFFDYFNQYYTAFDRWHWDFLRANFSTKHNDLVSIARSKLHKSKWRNMYGLKHIRVKDAQLHALLSNSNSNSKKCRTFQWKIRVLDRIQMEMEKHHAAAASTTSSNGNGDGSGDGGDADEKQMKKEDFELQYMEVLVGVVNVDKMPHNVELQRAFNQYSCGHALFGGNGKVYRNNEWIKVFRPLQHGDTVSINLRWMKTAQFYALYRSKEEHAQYVQQHAPSKQDEICVALTFAKNDHDEEESNTSYPKNAAFLLESGASYKLAVASARMRFEIEWISSNWICDDDEMIACKSKAKSNNTQDDNKQPE